MKDNGQYESNYFIIKISHDNVYFNIRQIFFLHKDAQNPFATSNFSAAKNVHNYRENRQCLRHFFFFLVTFIIEKSREKQIIKTKLDIQ